MVDSSWHRCTYMSWVLKFFSIVFKTDQSSLSSIDKFLITFKPDNKLWTWIDTDHPIQRYQWTDTREDFYHRRRYHVMRSYCKTFQIVVHPWLLVHEREELHLSKLISMIGSLFLISFNFVFVIRKLIMRHFKRFVIRHMRNMNHS